MAQKIIDMQWSFCDVSETWEWIWISRLSSRNRGLSPGGESRLELDSLRTRNILKIDEFAHNKSILKLLIP
jgi:hypothetical protein